VSADCHAGMAPTSQGEPFVLIGASIEATSAPMTITEKANATRREPPDTTDPRCSELSSAGHWSRRFASLVAPVGSAATWLPGAVIGLEHEYRVKLNGRTVDFRSLVHHLAAGRARLDPADLNAYRLASGAALTADEAEAEIALAPSLVRPGCGRLLADRARSERESLESHLPSGTLLEGYSTHLSVAVRPSCAVALAKLYASSFSAALMLLMDSVASPGLLVRPRPSRLELGGEFVDGDRLAVAAIFALGSVRACQARLERAGGQAEFPLRLRVNLRQDDQRYGWFVSRSAFASDLYLAGRETRLRPRQAMPISAQSHLERCWAAARASLVGDIDESELALVDTVVGGDEPLPARTPSIALARSSRHQATKVRGDATARAFGFATRAHSRPGYDLAPVMLTWDRAVFVASTPSRDRLAFAYVPAPLLTNFASLLEVGALDETIRCYLALGSGRRRLGPTTSTAEPGLYDLLVPRARLLVAERAPHPSKWTRKRFGAGAIRRGWRGTAGFGNTGASSGGHV